MGISWVPYELEASVFCQQDKSSDIRFSSDYQQYWLSLVTLS